MHTPLILTAFGTTSAARASYNHIEKTIRTRYPTRDIYWGYSSRVVARELKRSKDLVIQHPAEILKDLVNAGHKEATIQSLHLLPGHEFHSLHMEVRNISAIRCRMGLPLLASEHDYISIIEMLSPLITKCTDHAVVVVGHGTRHPVWPAYLALENLLQKRFGSRVMTGVVEHFPSSDHVVETICSAGYTKVLLIPFFLVAGLHYRRDMIGENEQSWKSRLEAKGLEVESLEEGIGMLDGIGDLVIRHIEDAESAR
ncbi:sirohydrochlorin cobaltochelatase [Desulfosediminicola flagellatus]|uniref:sirohydrochlorin cobaltochelatase n=1 Tax=Desulfosediminicola flagellatus TaxID=2569541 RepID=UPI0010AC7B67|nr:sirohydrochlorin cobaltochelatase [Desulfosediminicola flagellatus]